MENTFQQLLILKSSQKIPYFSNPLVSSSTSKPKKMVEFSISPNCTNICLFNVEYTFSSFSSLNPNQSSIRTHFLQIQGQQWGFLKYTQSIPKTQYSDSNNIRGNKSSVETTKMTQKHENLFGTFGKNTFGSIFIFDF